MGVHYRRMTITAPASVKYPHILSKRSAKYHKKLWNLRAQEKNHFTHREVSAQHCTSEVSELPPTLHQL